MTIKEKNLLIDMSVTTDNNISVKEFDEINKYKDSEVEIQKIRHLQITTVPVIVGALGMINGTNKIPGSYNLYEKEKKVFLKNFSNDIKYIIKSSPFSKLTNNDA